MMADPSQWQARMEAGIAAFGRKDYAAAEQAFRAAVLVAGAPGQGNLMLPRTLDHLGTTLQKLGRNDDARTQFIRMIQAQEVAVGAEHLEVATSFGRLAFLEASLGDAASAFKHHAQALRIREAQLGPLHPAVAMSLNNLGFVHTLRNERSQAEALWMRALAIREAACGPEHPDTAESLQNLGNLYRELGRYDEAEAMLARALDILERFPRDPRLHHALAMAAMVAQLRQPEKLRALEQRGLRIRDAAVRETADSREAAQAVSDFIELEEGNPQAAVGAAGAVRLLGYRAGHLFLENRWRGGYRAWTARGLSPQTFARFAQAFAGGGLDLPVFPIPSPGEAPRRLSLHTSREDLSSRLPARNDALGGEARALVQRLEGIIHTISGGSLAAAAAESGEALAGIRTVRVS